jgi:sugar phosphate isomerase/epimerase
MGHSTHNRRNFLRMAAGTTVAVSAASLTGALSSPAFAEGRLISRGKIGIQLYSVRDVIFSRGFRAVFEELARQGYQQVEFAGYTQDTSILGRQITVQEIRQLLDDNGLRAVGSHIGLGNFADPAQRQVEFDNAQILGMKHVGTANAPDDTQPSARKNTVDGYKAAADLFNTVGADAAARGLTMYQHNHFGEWAFAKDQPSVRLYDVFLNNTDPRVVALEMDIYWAFVGQYRYGGFNPSDYVIAHPHRYPLFHVKDGAADTANPDGYDMTEFGAGTLPYREFFESIGPKGTHLDIWEQDSAVNTPADRGGSLGAAARSYRAMVDLRG